MSKAENLIGIKFNKLTVIAESEKSKSGRPRWLCRCDCGNESIVLSYNLKNSAVKSCGCNSLEYISNLNKKHGNASKIKSSEYIAWESMNRRVNNPNYKFYKNYGGRGIAICSQWKNFEAFLEDMGKKPVGTTLDRIEVNGNYEPANCQWATKEQQANNTRANKFITSNGITLTFSQWAKRLGKSSSWCTVSVRQKGMAWLEERILELSSTQLIKGSEING